MNPETKNCQNCKKNFTIESEDFNFYEKIKVPPPTFCPDCRLQRRLASYNIRTLYKRNCTKCGNSMISIYAPESKCVAYCTGCYFSDEWDPMDYGRDYDFSKSFLQQFYELRMDVPQMHLRHSNNNGPGCEYSNSGSHSSYAYLSYGVVKSDHIYYSYLVNKENKMCVDSFNIKKNELCYELVNSNGNFKCIFLTDSNQCAESSFLFNCTNCLNCFMCTNLRNKNYCFRNEQLSREEYLKKISELNTGEMLNFENLKEEYEKMSRDSIHCYANIIKSEDCTGNIIENSKNVKESFNVWGCENLKFCAFLMNIHSDAYDITVAGRGERSYELVTSGGNGGNFDSKFSHRLRGGHNNEYCDTCKITDNLFGCVGLSSKSYCILNKQYSKEDYEEMREKIIKHMDSMPYVDKAGRTYKYGEYFPIEISQVAYNETLAIEQFPLTKEEALSQGYEWRDMENKDYKNTITISDLSRNIKDVNEDILKEVILCKHEGKCAHQCTKGYRIIEEELKFYKQMNIPLPTECPNCRYYKRLERRNPWKLWDRQCMCSSENHGHDSRCENNFKTNYVPDRPEIVYCKKCYQQEVY